MDYAFFNRIVIPGGTIILVNPGFRDQKFTVAKYRISFKKKRTRFQII